MTSGLVVEIAHQGHSPFISMWASWAFLPGNGPTAGQLDAADVEKVAVAVTVAAVTLGALRGLVGIRRLLHGLA